MEVSNFLNGPDISMKRNEKKNKAKYDTGRKRTNRQISEVSFKFDRLFVASFLFSFVLVF